MLNNMEEPKARIAVVGVGNLLLKDEGIGVHIARALQQMDIPQDTKIIDGGTSPDLPYYINGADKLVIIDAVKGGSKPGTVYRFHPGDVNIESEEMVSVHELGLEQSLKIMKLMGSKPREIVVIGIEPKEIDWGTELSAELQQKIPEIVNIVLKEINHQSDG
ncbi:Hydrogenase 1 maturation protease [subsurface metagenome]